MPAVICVKCKINEIEFVMVEVVKVCNLYSIVHWACQGGVGRVKKKILIALLFEVTNYNAKCILWYLVMDRVCIL